jgi:hypothetical protein
MERSSETDPLLGIQETSMLSTLFFHPQNIDTIQTELRYRVYQTTGVLVGRQSETELLIVMRSVYLQESRNLPGRYTEQIKELNEKVLEYCVKNVSSNALQYQQYIQDASTMPVPMAHPISTNITKYHTFSLNPAESTKYREYSAHSYGSMMR